MVGESRIEKYKNPFRPQSSGEYFGSKAFYDILLLSIPFSR